MKMSPLLQVEKLGLAFVDTKGQRQRVVREVGFSVQAGQCLGLVGESGSGKTLTALSCARLLPPGAMVHEDSRILFEGQDLLTLTEYQMRRIRGQEVGFIFQEALSALNPVLTIGQQMQETLKKRHRRHGQRYRLALETLDEVGLADPARAYRAYAHELSGGMRQRAMIAMALCGEPKLLIADEPTTALDVTVQAQVLDLLNCLRRSRGLALILISHDLSVVGTIADTVVVMKEGEIVEQAPVKQLFSAPQHVYSHALISAILPLSTEREPQQRETMCACRELRITFGLPKTWWRRQGAAHVAVSGAQFDIPRGGTVALVGESGSGKTSIGKALMHLCPRETGVLQWWDRGSAASRILSKVETRRHVQMLFQDSGSALNPRLLVQDSFMEALQAAGVVDKRDMLIHVIDEWLAEVGLDPSAKYRYPHQFSGGEKQRLCIVRALMMRPELLILDEPTSALDVSIQLQILKILQDLQDRLGVSYLLITHNWSVVAYLADAVVVLHKGHVVESGTVKEVLEHPQHQYTRDLLAAAPTLAHTYQRLDVGKGGHRD